VDDPLIAELRGEMAAVFHFVICFQNQRMRLVTALDLVNLSDRGELPNAAESRNSAGSFAQLFCADFEHCNRIGFKIH